MAVTVVGGLWGASVPVAIGCYSDKAKAKNEIKLSQAREIEALRAEIEALRGELAPKKRASPKARGPDIGAVAGQLRLALEALEGGEA